MMAVLASLLQREILLAWRNRSDVLSSLAFFLMVATLAPLALGADLATLRRIGPGMLWIAALLAHMLALQRLFAQDYADGTLEQWLLAPQPLSLLVAGKVLAHWLCTGLPLVLLCPLLALQFDLAPAQWPALAASLLLGTPVLSLIGAIAAALTLGLRGAGVLLAVLVLPLYVPVLIFGTAAAGVAQPGAHLQLLGGMLAAAAALAPWATAAALRIAME